MKDAFDAILQPQQATYLEGIEPPRDALLAEMEIYAREHGGPISDPEVASFMAVAARAASGASRMCASTSTPYWSSSKTLPWVRQRWT